MTEDEFSRVAGALWRQYGIPALGANEFTISTLAQELGITYNRAQPIIARGLADGGIVSVGKRRMPDGHLAQAFRRTAE